VALAGETIAATALSFLGAPYESGGTGPDGFDCSGFVQYVYSSAGVALPRSVREQLDVGVPVERDVRAGDLVFFAIDGRGVSHVGIATSAGAFVHAPSSRGVVREERLDAPYWATRLVAVRRVIVSDPAAGLEDHLPVAPSPGRTIEELSYCQVVVGE
jgi:cell wall-associated NlpC family hydrolase